MTDTTEHTDEFTSQEKAEAFLIDTMEEEFKGRTFTIYSRDKNTYTLNGEKYGSSLYSYIIDQDGNIANAGITADGKLWTDYLPSYYMKKLAQPIENLLNQFDFIENYAITLDDWDESDSFNDLDWTVDEFFEHTRRVYQIKLFLPQEQDKETYVNQAYEVYEHVYKGITESFDMEFYIEGSYYVREAGNSGIEKIFSNRIHQSIHNHVGDFGKDPKSYFEDDLKPNHAEDDFYSNLFEDYGVVWKHLPEKITE
ncbi:hypothetical protein [Enterococcus sp. BWR-S5]|uniref:hypothetical protein n=1 Tax=Enterococcus sp. BWR-S5 TaxID=2787714 RepID=UPI0019207A31|nr:hypothetical protein [Enterococcus sp. BWR-S5]MBL1227494.1 hypothetical protein [Enterococcus sp. BWR-S5]